MAKDIHIDVRWDGSVYWNGKKLADDDAVERCLKAVSKRSPQPRIHFVPDRKADWSTVARVLRAAQSAGVNRIGFVGNEQLE